MVARAIVLRHLATEPEINNRTLRRLTGLNYDQAIKFFARMVEEGMIVRLGRASGTRYLLRTCQKGLDAKKPFRNH
jgi:DNA-binding IclR family transcriptional regulator